MCGGIFDLFKRIISLRLQNEIALVWSVQPDDEVRLVIVHLAVMQIRDRETQARVLHKGTHSRMGVNVISRCLLPSPRVRDEAIDMGFGNLAHFTSRPEVHFAGRTWATRGFQTWNFRRLTVS